MAIYDRLGIKWHPYIMYFQTPNFSSPIVNTDSFGFRLTPFQGIPISPMNPSDYSSCNLLIGGSTAFGVGAESDNGTIAAHLSSHTKSAWLNMGGRAFTAMQEFAVSASVYQDLPRIDSIVIVSGFNNLYLAQRNLPFELPLGSFFFQQTFESAMEESSRGRLQRLSRMFGKQDDWHSTTSRTIDEAIELAVRTTRQSLLLWVAIAQSIGARILFALQPTSMWSEREPIAKESQLFAALSEFDPALSNSLARINLDAYRKYRVALDQLAKDCGIGFLDLNQYLLMDRALPDWFYVDRVHYTGAGYRRIAEGVLSAM